MARPKQASVELQSTEDANRALRALLLAEVELEKCTGALDLARAAATAQFEKPIDRHKSAISDLTLQLQIFYMAHHKDLEKDGAKSIRLAFGVIGRRLGRPALKPLNRSWTWASIGIKLRSVYHSRFFHAPDPPAVDREKTRQELNDEQLKECGLKVEQEETFFAETDRTTLGEAGFSFIDGLCWFVGCLVLITLACLIGAVIPLWMARP